MEFDYKNLPKDGCPNVLCGQKKEDCCWVTKVVIAAVLGDDSEGSPVKPKNANNAIKTNALFMIYYLGFTLLYYKERCKFKW